MVESFFTRWERVIKATPLRRRDKTPTMEQDDEVAAVARIIWAKWMDDERFLSTPMAYFWAELAARALKDADTGGMDT